jgi:hypothetical protein
MSGIIWILIPLVAIVGGYIIDYQKNKLKWQQKNTQSDEELEELRKLMFQMKKRIENLEAIAAGDPSEFKSREMDPQSIIEIVDSNQIKRENELNVAKMAKTKGD